jgi:hypothetical protein
MLMLMLMIREVMEMDDLTDSDDCHSTSAALLLLTLTLLLYPHLFSSILCFTPFSYLLLSVINVDVSIPSILYNLLHLLFSFSPLLTSHPCFTPFRNIFVRFEIRFGFLTNPSLCTRALSVK